MKKLFCIFLAIVLMISLSACRKNKKDPTVDNHTNGNQLQNQTGGSQTEKDTSLVAVSLPTQTQNEIHDDGTTLFQYTFQHMSLVLHKPQVADKIILDFLNRVDSTTAAAESTKEMAKNAYNGSQNWTPYLYHITYSPTRIDHKVLSLFGNNVVFSGAGHPERTCVSASYDLLTGDVLTLASIMSKDATVQQFCDLTLAGLGEMAEGDYLYDNYKKIVQQRFQQDASQDEAWYFTQTGLCFYFAPYEIAPYSSGVITVEIPFEKLKNLIHADYLPSARTSPTGKITVTPFNNTNLNNLAHIAEIVMEEDGKMYMLQTDGNVQDVRIVLYDKASNCNVFASYGLGGGNGIMVQGSEETLKSMKITYKTGKDTVTIPIVE